MNDTEEGYIAILLCFLVLGVILLIFGQWNQNNHLKRIGDALDEQKKKGEHLENMEQRIKKIEAIYELINPKPQ